MDDRPSQRAPLGYSPAPDSRPARLANAALLAAGAFVIAVPLACSSNLTGLLPLLLLMTTPFVALALGIAARVTSAPDDVQTRGKARLAINTGCVGIAILLMVLPAVSQMGRPRESSNRVKCLSNLRHVGQALEMYANANAGVLPARLDVLLPNIDIERHCFVCPSAGQTPAPGATAQQAAAAMAASPAKHLSYAFHAAGARFPALPSNVVLVCEPSRNHDGGGMNVLFADKHVEWVDARTAKHVLAELAAGHNPPRGFTPARAAK